MVLGADSLFCTDAFGWADGVAIFGGADAIAEHAKGSI